MAISMVITRGGVQMVIGNFGSPDFAHFVIGCLIGVCISAAFFFIWNKKTTRTAKPKCKKRSGQKRIGQVDSTHFSIGKDDFVLLKTSDDKENDNSAYYFYDSDELHSEPSREVGSTAL